MKCQLLYSVAFSRSAKRFIKKRPDASLAIEEALSSLATDAFDPKLRTHKLVGAFAGSWSCSAGYDLRIIFKFVKSGANDAILLISLGTHDDVY